MQKETLVWDMPTRLCHWLIAVGVLYAWFSIEILEDMEQHFWTGYSVLCLVLFRLIWGFVGSRYARFSSFIFPLSEIVAYAKTLPDKNSKHYLGHNPVGSLSAILMLAGLALQTTTGLFNTDDYFFGPLSGLVTEGTRNWLGDIHEDNFDILCLIIGLHIGAIVFYRWHKKQKLTRAMISGKKVLEQNDKAATTEHAVTASGIGLLIALVVLALCIAAVYATANCCLDSIPSGDYEF